MRKPQFSYERRDDSEHKHPECSGPLARMKRFLSLSLGGSGSGESTKSNPRTTKPSHSTNKRTLPIERHQNRQVMMKPPIHHLQTTRDVVVPWPTTQNQPSQTLNALKHQIKNGLGKSLEELLQEEDDYREEEKYHGVPTFVHSLCSFLLTHGVDYDSLLDTDFCEEDFMISVLGDSFSPPGFETSVSDSALAAGLFRLFLQKLPEPLLNKAATAALFRIKKDQGSKELGGSDSMKRIRSVLIRKVPVTNLHFLQYFINFLHRLQVATNSTCPVASSQLAAVLTRTLTEESKRDSKDSTTHHIAEMLLVNHSLIFRDIALPAHIQQQIPTDYNSDSVSSTCDSRADEEEEGERSGVDLLFSPEELGEGVGGGGGGGGSSCSGERNNRRRRKRNHSKSDDQLEGELEDEDDSSTTTTTDTDDFRSPAISPLHQNTPPFIIGRRESTDEVSDIDSYHSKIAPCGKDYLPSITGFVTSPGESWTDEKLRRDVDDFGSSSVVVGQSAESSSCISGGDLSEENDGDRDADASEEGGGINLPFQCPNEERRGINLPFQCPNEERRLSERFYHPKGYGHSSGSKRPKRKTRRKHSSKDTKSSRVPSSEEEERNPISSSGFASLLNRDDEEEPPVAFDPTPSESPNNNPFMDLLDSSDPIQSDRSDWCLRRDEQVDNWQRTQRHYSREDDEVQAEPLTSSWFQENTDSYAVSGETKFNDQQYNNPGGLPDDFSSSPRSGGSHAAIKTLSKHASSVKRKIKKFEEEFEMSYGYRPSHSEKMKYPHVKKHVTELSKTKKELKQMKDEMPEKKKSKSFSISLLRCQESTSQASSSSSSHKSSSEGPEDTLQQVEARLTTKRDEASRPTELSLLTVDQYQEEKIDLQKALLYYESMHGRPVTHEDRDRVRPLYDRYRQVKRGIARISARSKESIELAPIIEHQVMDFTLASPQHRGSLQEQEENKENTPTTQITEDDNVFASSAQPEENLGSPFDSSSSTTPTSSSTAPSEINLGDLHALPIYELKERKKMAKEQKKKIRKNLRDFEEKFEVENGRKMLKEERGPMENAYTQYKHVKAKLRLLEALLSKHDSRYI